MPRSYILEFTILLLGSLSTFFPDDENSNKNRGYTNPNLNNSIIGRMRSREELSSNTMFTKCQKLY